MAGGRGGRVSYKLKSRPKKKHAIDSFTYGFKYSVLLAHDAGDSHEDLRKKFSAKLGKKTGDAVRGLVNRWSRQRELITRKATNASTANQLRDRTQGTATTLSTAQEEVIVQWINELRRDGVPVSSRMLGLKALDVAAEASIPRAVFAASNTWKASFLRRHRFSFRAKNRAGQSSPDNDAEISRAFASEVVAWMEEHGTTRVYNADQTGVFFEMLPKRTIADRGSSTVWVKCGTKEKQRATAMLLADSDGNKYTPFIVFKTTDSVIKEVQKENDSVRHGFGKNLWTEILDLQRATGAEIYGNPTAWWNEDLTVAWLEHFFGDRTVNSEPVLLLLDSFSGHWTEEVEACALRLNVSLKSVPPKLTWRCQPADVAWMKPLKDGLRRKWVEQLREQLDRRRNRTRRFRMRPPDRGDIAEWITAGWESLSDKIVISGFSKCGFRPAVPGDAPVEEEPYETTTLIAQLEYVGWIDETVGAVNDCIDSPAEITEVVV